MALTAIITAGMLFPGSPGEGQEDYHTWRRPEIQVPISLAIGTVRTPPFHVKKADYAIIIQVARRLPFGDLKCMFRAPEWSGGVADCTGDSLVQEEWKVLDEDKHVLAQGSEVDRGTSSAISTDYLLKYIGNFKGERGRTYTLEESWLSKIGQGFKWKFCSPAALRWL
jgi:hypothetical protein